MLTIIELDGALDNDPAGCLVDLPLIEGGDSGAIQLTGDGWHDLRVRRAAAGRPLDWWEIPANG